MSRLKLLQDSLTQYGVQYTSSPRILTSYDPTSTNALELDFPFRVFVPENYEPGYAYPLVVWLHSDESSELELDNVMATLSRRNYIAIAPRANVRLRDDRRLYRWGKCSTDCAVAEELVWDSVQAAMESLSVHPDRIFLAGFGSGATMAQWIGLKYASQVAGVVSLSGCFPKISRVLSNWKKARDLNVLFAQRQGSALCSDEELLRAIKIGHQSGLLYTFLQARSGGIDSQSDDLDASMLEAANRFMMGIVTGTNIKLTPERTCDSECVEFGCN
jgi:phospholipase/carboxylesterase